MRISWDDYFMDMAYLVATRATCSRRHVGCVLVKDRRVLATGYNGSMPGQPHCDDAGHFYMNGEENGCQRTNHAEASAIAFAAKFGVSVDGATCYVTTMPCYTCAKLLIMAGIKRIVFHDKYRFDEKFQKELVKQSQVDWAWLAFYQAAEERTETKAVQMQKYLAAKREAAQEESGEASFEDSKLLPLPVGDAGHEK